MNKLSTILLQVGGMILLGLTSRPAVAQEASPFQSLAVPTSWNLPVSVSYTVDWTGQFGPEYAAREKRDLSVDENSFTYVADRSKWQYQMYRVRNGKRSLDIIHWYNDSMYGQLQASDGQLIVSSKPENTFDYARKFNHLLAPFQFLVRTPQYKYDGFSAPSYAAVCDADRWKAFFKEAALVRTDSTDKGEFALYKTNVFVADKKGNRCYYLVTFVKGRIGAPIRVEKFLEDGERVCDVSVESFQEIGGNANTPGFSLPTKVKILIYDDHNVLRCTNIATLRKIAFGEKISPDFFDIDYSMAKSIMDYDNKTMFMVPSVKSSAPSAPTPNP